MFKEVVSLAIIAGFIANIVCVEHPNTTSYTIGFVLSMAVMSPFALAWRYRASARQLRAMRVAVEGAVEDHFVSVSGASRASKDVQPSADVEMGLMQTERTAAVPLEET
jgi:hypothetical protein